ncbi:MAG TPA: acetate/propionate family kinase [Acidobacteriota bacterium]|nr:acetate/propionate family kinase [Acidobacteriota bacterium]HRR56674.1 acetate/propionate family kinase [Acidobacteriota bacterium]
MKILVCNLGSTSFKFQVLDMPVEHRLARGTFEKIGSGPGRARFWRGDRLVEDGSARLEDHPQAVELAIEWLRHDAETDPLTQVSAVAFKCVQGGAYNGTVRLTEEVLAAMEEVADLAPAHNPPYLKAIRRFRSLLPDTPLVGVFEPGFHTTMPEYAKLYGVPFEWYERYGVQRYGYHGASHRYVTGEAVRRLGLPQDAHKVVSCHLGGSSSLCAVRNGVSIDTSMGFTPQSGLIQGSRTGDLDPYVIPYLMRRTGMSAEAILQMCASKGGLAGISGVGGDMREILEAARAGSRRAELARRKLIYDVKRYLGQYLVLLGGLDAVVFTGGMGEHDFELREEVLRSLEFLGLRLDETANRSDCWRITEVDSPIQGLVIPSDEELVVARETVRLLQKAGSP